MKPCDGTKMWGVFMTSFKQLSRIPCNGSFGFSGMAVAPTQCSGGTREFKLPRKRPGGICLGIFFLHVDFLPERRQLCSLNWQREDHQLINPSRGRSRCSRLSFDSHEQKSRQRCPVQKINRHQSLFFKTLDHMYKTTWKSF